MKAVGLLYTLGKTSLDKSEGDQHYYELHVTLPSVGLVNNPKLSKILHACTALKRIILDRATNMTLLLNHNWPNLTEIEAYHTEDRYTLQLAQHYATVRSVQLFFGCGSWNSVKQLAAINHVTDIGLVCDSDHNRDLFRFVRTEPKVTFIDVKPSNNVEVNLLANVSIFPYLKKISVHFGDDIGYGETFKNFLASRGNMLELLLIETHDVRDVPRKILENNCCINQLICRFQLNNSNYCISKDELEIIFKIPVQKEASITFTVSNREKQKLTEQLIKRVQPKYVRHKLEVKVCV